MLDTATQKNGPLNEKNSHATSCTKPPFLSKKNKNGNEKEKRNL